jgi:hypothetical protein
VPPSRTAEENKRFKIKTRGCHQGTQNTRDCSETVPSEHSEICNSGRYEIRTTSLESSQLEAPKYLLPNTL